MGCGPGHSIFLNWNNGSEKPKLSMTEFARENCYGRAGK
jgi:hypothetical protein